MASVEREVYVARNPATNELIAQFEETPPDSVRDFVSATRLAANEWSRRPITERIEIVRQWWKELCRDADSFAAAIRDEIGKPLPEAQIEVTATLDAILWVLKNARSVLGNERLPAGWQRFALMNAARQCWVPLGVVGIIGTWNYPLLLDAPAIASALVAGNGVVWKPSESSLHVAHLLFQSLERAKIPSDVVTQVIGGAAVGRALTRSRIDKGFFTGGSANGRMVATSLAKRGIPVVCELSGFDPAIVVDFGSAEKDLRALTWAAFVGAGQTCVAVKRIYAVGPSVREFAVNLAESACKLRVGDPSGEVDVGPMISESARERFHARIQEAIAAGAQLLCGGEPIAGPGWFYRPTVLYTKREAAVRSLAGVFGPVVIVRKCESEEYAIRMANGTMFGLAASVWCSDMRRARTIASRLNAGTVAINDAVTPTGLASAPFGGVKGSGFGRVRGILGLREFASPQVIHSRSPGGFRPHLFPYSARFLKILGFYRSLFHRG